MDRNDVQGNSYVSINILDKLLTYHIMALWLGAIKGIEYLSITF